MMWLLEAQPGHAAHFVEPDVVLADMEMSEWARLAMLDGEPLAIVGVAVVGGWAMPWLYVTPLAARRRATFWRACKAVFGEIRSAYPAMTQVVRPEHEGWARRLGFTLGEIVTMDGAKVRQIHILEAQWTQ